MRISGKDPCHTSDFNSISFWKGVFTEAFPPVSEKLCCLSSYALLTLIVKFENKEIKCNLKNIKFWKCRRVILNGSIDICDN